MIFSSSAQKGANSEAKIKAVFLYNFTRFVEWPARSFSSETAPFVIGIIGEDPFGAYIEQAIVGEKVNSHPIVIRRFNSIAEIEDCHILFVNLHDGGMINAAKHDLAHLSLVETLSYVMDLGDERLAAGADDGSAQAAAGVLKRVLQDL